MQNKFLAPLLISVLLVGGCGGGPESEDKKQAIPKVSFQEAKIREDGRESSIRFSINAAADYDIAITLAPAAEGAAAGTDFSLSSFEMVIPAGKTSATVEVTPIDDDLYEGDEINAISITVTSGQVEMPDIPTTFVTILENDAVPQVELSAETYSAAESAGTLLIPVSLSRPSSTAVQVPYSISGTASNGRDYLIENTGNIEISAGQITATIDVAILADALTEGGETIIISASEGAGYTLSKKRTASIIIAGDTAMNDTGIVDYSDGTFLTSIPQPLLPGQDADTGLDTEENSDTDGSDGFNFTKIDNNGNELPQISNEAICVRDNNTGLLWEIKTQDEDFSQLESESESWITQAGNFLYTWHTLSTTNSGGSLGARNASDLTGDLLPSTSSAHCAYSYPSQSRQKPACATSDYTRELSLFSRCGAKNWRLPTLEELRSIVSYQSAENGNGAFDDVFFGSVNIGTSYLTATPSAKFSGSAWCIDADTAFAKLCNKGGGFGVIAVSIPGEEVESDE